MPRAVLVVLAFGCGAEPAPAERDRVPPCLDEPAPTAGRGGGNVLLVVMDDVGVDKLGAYGVHPRPAPTPRLDALAARGTWFQSAYGEPSCSPGRAAILTGRRPIRTGVGTNVGRKDGGLPDEEVLLPEALQVGPERWSTAAIGKWHLSRLDDDAPGAPLRQGFDHFDGLLANPNVTLDRDGSRTDYFSWERVLDGELSIAEGYLTTAQADAAIEAMRTLPEPWFVYLAFSGAHIPLHVPPDELWSEADPDDGEPGTGDAMIEALDAELGRVVDAAGPTTTILVTSDNGTSAHLSRPPSDPDRGKLSVYTGGVHVPLLVVGPDVLARRSDALVHTTDLFPTVLDLAGIDPADAGAELDGRSLRPILEGRADAVRRCVAVERFGSDGVPDEHTWVSVLDEAWALVRGPDRPDELYRRDPLAPVEGDDLLATLPTAPDAALALERLQTWLRRDFPRRNAD